MPGPGTEGALEARRAVSLAGRALDPNASGGPSLALGQRLLREAFIAGVRAICRDPTIDSVDAGARALDRRGESRVAARSVRRRSEAIAALVEALPDRAALARAEIEVARLVDEATGEHRLTRATRRASWVLVLLVVSVTATFGSAAFVLRRPWEAYTWVASSGVGSFPRSGTLGWHEWRYDLVVHTEEEENPWVVVDLLATRSIDEVVLVNRADCCRERGLPLTLELAGEDRQFVPMATRATLFDVWQVTFPRQKARYLRLSARAKTVIQLREIRIR